MNADKKLKSNGKTRTIKVDYLARVEGEGGFDVKISNGKVTNARLKIFEPPRFFEAFLRGRNYYEAPDITARICGICPIAYQMSSCHAMEYALGAEIPKSIRELRRLFYCGEWIESHVLHIFMLHAPDFLGYEDAIRMAKQFPEEVKMALRMKKIGNDLVRLLGGREIHPINARVGGFYRVPKKSDLTAMLGDLKWTMEASVKTLKLVSTFDFPDMDKDYEFVSLRHPDEYPFNEGNIFSSKGIDIPVSEFEQVFEEVHIKHSTSLHCRIKNRGYYMVGPLARFNNNFDKLPKEIQQEAKKVGFLPGSRNQFKSIIARAVETMYACWEAIRIIENYEMPEKPSVEIPIHAATGYGCTEAPRGILYHRYRLDDKGIILSALIIPPTSQNQGVIEEDLTDYVNLNYQLPKEDLTWKCEQLIRNYDPCISCSCHFLKLNIMEEDE